MARYLASALAFFSGTQLYLNDAPAIVKAVNEDAGILSVWESEKWDSTAVAGYECHFFDFKEKYFSEGCSQFIVSRTSTAPQQAAKRATACAAEHGTSCVLSTEVGLSIPAVFLFRVDRMVILIAPRVVSVAKENEEVHVRVSDPSKDGIFGTKTVLMNYSIEIEYLDGDSRGLVSETIHDDEAFCVQLLRGAYVDDCWEKLD